MTDIGVGTTALTGPSSVWARLNRRSVRRTRATGPTGWQLVIIGLLGCAATAVVAYLVSENPHAAPAHVAVALRVVLILTLLTAGIFCLTGRGQARMGALLIGAGVYACVWLLNGSRDRLAFSLGLLAAGLAPTVFAYLVLAYPTGWLRSNAERLLVAGGGGALALFWTLYVFSQQPPLRSPLVSPPTPNDVFSAFSISADTATVLKVGIWTSWALITLGSAVLVSWAVHTGARRGKRSWIPFELAAWLNALCFLAYVVARTAGSESAGALGAAYVEVALAIPVAILIKLAMERAEMARALSSFLGELAETPHADLQGSMARALEDPSLTIAYHAPGRETYVDGSGSPVAVPQADPNRAVTWIEPTHGPPAAVIYDARLADQSSFVEAAGMAATIHLDAAQLEAELTTSTSELAASRFRLMEAANAERQRIERDLHDGVQQQIVGLRLKLDLATDAIKADPVRGERMLAAVGRELDGLLQALRSLAKGIYPTIIKERGLREALASMALTVPLPISVSAIDIGRYQDDIEIAVYFCCVEALQNVVKHGGPDSRVLVRLWRADAWLRFEVRDHGSGFDVEAMPRGSGLINMTDRIEAVGGHLWVMSRPGHGTIVRGKVPAVRGSR